MSRSLDGWPEQCKDLTWRGGTLSDCDWRGKIHGIFGSRVVRCRGVNLGRVKGFFQRRIVTCTVYLVSLKGFQFGLLSFEANFWSLGIKYILPHSLLGPLCCGNVSF